MDYIKNQINGSQYNDPEFFKKENQNIFNRTWQYVCQATEISEAGSYVTTKLGTEPIIILRGGDGELRAFHNVCPHRGARLFYALA